MGEIKRVLWVDDYLSNPVSGLFIEEETKKVDSMDKAIREITGDHLYDYDTIVLDIDFENGLHDAETVIQKLSQKIYLSKDQREKDFIISNGGYLLFLYLLEKGYPSEQVAFLTGNAGIISQLQEYTQKNLSSLSKKEIREEFVKAWESSEGNIEEFEKKIDALPISALYQDSEFVLDCAEYLEEGMMEELENKIQEVTPPLVTGSIHNTGDMMIFRFHEANLESPIYFSKNDNDIAGHNRTDAEAWLKEKRTSENVTRWLLLSVGDYIENLFRLSSNAMERQLGGVFRNIVCDGGIRSAFRQMYFVFDGLKAKHRGIYYQAMAAMLIPFDASPKYCGDSVVAAGVGEDTLRRMFANCAKQARNYCAHNYFGTSITDETTLFLLLITVTAILTREQREEISDWYQRTAAMFEEDRAVVSGSSNISKIDHLMTQLLLRGDIDTSSARVESDSSDYKAHDFMRAFGYNTAMSRNAESSTTKREEYFVFSLAAYILKWFEGMSDTEIGHKFGKEVLLVHNVARKIVVEYTYPRALPS